MLTVSRIFGMGLLLWAAPADAAILAQWVQLGPEHAVSIRVITDADACPAIIVDGAPGAMHMRAAPETKFTDVPPASFAVRSCESDLPADAQSATIDGRSLPLPHGEPQRILLFGDTGCRLKGKAVQDCNDANAWPFPRIAAAAAAAHPDLVIHLGDYNYRETACPAGYAGCAGSPSGYGWDSWNADFFTPAAPLLAAAPWAMVRGNHENCERSGEGWFRFLDAGPAAEACRDLAGMFVTQLGTFGLLNIDSAKADDPRKGQDRGALAEVLHGQFERIAARIPAEAWLVTHQPLDAVLGVKGRNVVGNGIMESAFGADLPGAVHMLVSGHIHFFQALDFGGLHAPQLVVGTGGDNLDPVPPQSVLGAMVNGSRVVSAVTYSGFGYMLWERQGPTWSGVLYDADAKKLGSCRLEGRSLACQPA